MNENKLKEMIRGALKVTPFKRRAFFVVSDFLLISFSMAASFWLRFGGDIPRSFVPTIIAGCGLSLAVKFPFLAFYGMYGFSWRFFGIQELIKLFRATALASLTLGVLLFFMKTLSPFMAFPRAILLLDFVATFGLLAILRVSKRAAREYRLAKRSKNRKGVRVLVIGAGEAGQQIVKAMRSGPSSKYNPVGYIDDDPAKQGLTIQEEKVLGTREDIPRIMREFQVEEALVALPSAASKDIREIVRLLHQADAQKRIKILPSVIELMERDIALKDIQEVKVEDLLGRVPVSIDFESIRNFVAGKRVLITGAAGSIGSELVRTVLQFRPSALAAVDIDETEIYYLLNRVRRDGNTIIPVIGDVRDEKMLRSIFGAHTPQIVIHSAAYKHVPILERFYGEAIKTNILATRSLGRIAMESGVEKFVFISTDKAINPTSVMGASKRIAEEILGALNARNGTKFVSVRFGNVLGSRGSVIPLFKEQIQRGGPVTVTHPDVKRYFMATGEAVLLVLEAAAVGDGGEVFVLDMGNPVKIEDLAKEMIRLSGFEPGVDIPIVYTGLRPGEKMFEELVGTAEDMERLKYEKILKIVRRQNPDAHVLFELVDELDGLCAQGCSKKDVVNRFRRLVPSYTPDMSEGATPNWW